VVCLNSASYGQAVAIRVTDRGVQAVILDPHPEQTPGLVNVQLPIHRGGAQPGLLERGYSKHDARHASQSIFEKLKELVVNSYSPPATEPPAPSPAPPEALPESVKKPPLPPPADTQAEPAMQAEPSASIAESPPKCACSQGRFLTVGIPSGVLGELQKCTRAVTIMGSDVGYSMLRGFKVAAGRRDLRAARVLHIFLWATVSRS
jgi:hypothetical protein